jgi:hypothetical protein
MIHENETVGFIMHHLTIQYEYEIVQLEQVQNEESG